MRSRSGSLLAVLAFVTAACFSLGARPSLARELTFEDRLRAREAIERVYYSHRVGATVPFGEAVPRAILEKKVTLVLAQSAALERIWRAPLTADMLRRELERMAAASRYPERLDEIARALGNDRVLLAECLARPILVDRLIRQQFAGDPRFNTGPSADSFSTAESFEAWWSGIAAGFDPARVSVPEGLDAGILQGWETAHRPAASTCVPKDGWDNGIFHPSLDPDRTNFSAVWTGSEMIVWGGSGLASGLRYDPSLESWTPTSLQGAPAPRSGHVAAWTGSHMLIWGGAGSSSVYLQSGGSYDPVSDSWTPTNTAGAPSGRVTATAVWSGTELIVWGGINACCTTATGGRYNPTMDRWTPTAATGAPSARHEAVAVWTGSRMIIWGGRTTGGLQFDTGGIYNPSNNTWAATSTTGAPIARYGATAVWTGTEMIVWSGANGGTVYNSGGRYNPAENTWTSTSMASVPSGRRYSRSIWTGSEMIVWGGSDVSSSLNTGGRYRPSDDTWVPTSTSAGVPSPSSNHTTLWTGSFMIVWVGGSNSGGRYNPKQDSWTPTEVIPVVPPPSSRWYHTAIWTGTEMILWGGVLPSGSATAGGVRYDPVLDSWTPTAMAGAPSARVWHTAVWTGTEMIVLGGWGPPNVSGGRYNPASDTWDPTSAANAPTQRIHHTAVWTGSRVIVWGGRKDDLTPNGPSCDTEELADGAEYDPAGDVWTSIPASPLGRRGSHTAVWTGTEMIVWGGDYLFYLPDTGPCYRLLRGDGARYDPATHSWTSTSDFSSRSHHTAVWTGTKMILWGGAVLGAVYEPTSNTWTTTSTIAEPSVRADHIAVWTGSHMIVWDGASDRSGGRYSPTANTWSATSVEGAPPSLGIDKGVWDGSAMLVFGSGGGRYFDGQADTDGDGTAGTCDPCPLDSQNDADGDGLCANSDNCPSLSNPLQYDADSDGIGDACDICPAASDPYQKDLDGDGAGDACDCQPDNPSVRKPPEVNGLMVQKSGVTAHLAWSPGPFANTYAIARGALSVGGPGHYGSCLVSSLMGTTADDASIAPPGDGFFYLIVGESACGAGSLGRTSSGGERINSDPGGCN